MSHFARDDLCTAVRANTFYLSLTEICDIVEVALIGLLNMAVITVLLNVQYCCCDLVG